MNLIPKVVGDIDKLASRTVQTDSRNASGEESGHIICNYTQLREILPSEKGNGGGGGEETQGQVPKGLWCEKGRPRLWFPWLEGIQKATQRAE